MVSHGRPARRAIASRGAGDEPVVGVDEIEADPVGDLLAQLPHVLVHRVHPAHERLDVLGERRLREPVDDHPVTVLDRGQRTAATGEHMDLDTLGDEVLRQLADMACKATLDDRRVLPGDDQHAHDGAS